MTIRWCRRVRPAFQRGSAAALPARDQTAAGHRWG